MNKTKVINHRGIIRRSFSSMAAATFLAALIALCSGRTAQATIYTLTIPDTVPWTDTGINIAAGYQLQITATGTAIFGFSPGQSCGPNGTTGVFYPGSVVPVDRRCSQIRTAAGACAVVGVTHIPEGRQVHATIFVEN